MTDPVTPVVNAVTSEVQAVLKQARSHHYEMLGLTTLLVAALLFVMFLGAKSYEKALSKADSAYAALRAKDAADTASLIAHSATRVEQTKDMQIAQKNTDDRDAKSEMLKAKIVVANASDAEVLANSTKYLHEDGKQTAEGDFVYKKAAVQEFVATKIDDDTLTQDKADLTVKIVTLTNQVSTTQADLTVCETDKILTEKDLQLYKKAATKSKWAKALDATEKVGLFAAGAYLGSKLSK